MTLARTVVANIRKLRRQRRLSQEKLGRLAGFSTSFVSMLERGVRAPTLDTIDTLAKALRVPPLRLFDR